MATKNQKQDPTEDWWDILMLSPHASVRDIHHAYETLRMSYLPIKRDRSIPVSPETTDQLQKLDRAFRSALDSKDPSATARKKATSKTSSKASNKTTTKSAQPSEPSEKDPFHSVVQEWAKTAPQSPLPTATGSTAPVQNQTPSGTTEGSQHTKTSKQKSATGNTKTSKKGSNGYWLLFIFIVFGVGGYLFGGDSKPVSSNAAPNRSSAPAPRAAPSPVPAQTPPAQYAPSPTVPDPLVLAVQQELNKKGFNAGVADGLLGRQTRDAVSSAQSALNLFVDGVPSEALLRALRRY